jgi:glutaredoxin
VSDQVVRGVVVLVVVVVAILVASVARKLARPVHPEITVGDVGDRPGVVLFTSTDCSNCKEAIALLKAESVPFREITHELEPQRFESWTVLAVPLTVVLDADGGVVDMMSGVPRPRTLRKAIRVAGITQR